MNPDRCDSEIYEHGEQLMALDAPKREANRWVAEVANRSGQRVDWHYVGGRVRVIYIGDAKAVEDAAEALLPTLNGHVLSFERRHL